MSLPVGEDGLILFGGSQVMLGYLNDPDKTAGVIVEIDGKRWYKTGDKAISTRTVFSPLSIATLALQKSVAK